MVLCAKVLSAHGAKNKRQLLQLKAVLRIVFVSGIKQGGNVPVGCFDFGK